jgi:hypothetical protein
MNALQKVARKAALELLDSGAAKKKWTPFEREQWTKAFNALQRLSGKKIIWRGGKLVEDDNGVESARASENSAPRRKAA